MIPVKVSECLAMVMENDKEFIGNAVREAIKKYGVSGLSQKTGVSRSTLHRIKKGNVRIYSATFKALFRFIQQDIPRGEWIKFKDKGKRLRMQDSKYQVFGGQKIKKQ